MPWKVEKYFIYISRGEYFIYISRGNRQKINLHIEGEKEKIFHLHIKGEIDPLQIKHHQCKSFDHIFGRKYISRQHFAVGSERRRSMKLSLLNAL